MDPRINLTAGPPPQEAETTGTVQEPEAGPQLANRKEYLFFLTASALFLLGLLTAVGYLLLAPFWAAYAPILADKDHIRALLEATGSWGPLVYILLQSLFVVLPPTHGEAMGILGGFLFGVRLGFLYSMAGVVLGSVICFELGRWLERRFVVKIIRPEKLLKFRLVMKREGTLAAFLIFLVPAIPKDFVCYGLGLTRMSLKFFVVAVAVARFPTTLLYTLQGARVTETNYWIIFGGFFLYLGLALFLYRHREVFYHWTSRWHLE